ncbi:MAG: ABC transporter ATP-binding protein [Flavobacterium sp.]|nr:MAG: ABC transporter ATP-binding protein [Flavobacterium sp.]
MLEARNISFSYTDSKAIDGLNFSIAKGNQVAVIGESGCGKSTLLKLIYGMYDLDEGLISFDGKPILGPKFKLLPGEDYIKYLAQDFGLMPYTTVAENVGNFLSNIDKSKKRARTQELLEMVEMEDFNNVKPQFLSGGQQQRVALAKVLALEPELLLLDEPFSQIDTFRANTLRRNLFRYFKEKGITCLMATHDSVDVLSFSDETIVMKDGKIVASGSPKSIYENPPGKYVASLFGDVNEIPESFLKKDGEVQKTIFVYPAQLTVCDMSNLRVTVTSAWYKGSCYLIEGLYQNGKIYFESEKPLPKGALVNLKLMANAAANRF